jgi:hypothetical protein
MHTAAERPDLWDRGIESATVWLEYNLHGDILNRWWGHLEEELADYQFVIYDDVTDQVVAEGHTGPFRWDGQPHSLPLGIDAVLELIFTQHRAGETPNTLCPGGRDTSAEPGQRDGVTAVDRDAHDRHPSAAHPLCRSCPAVAEGALPTDPHRAVRHLAPRRSPTVRPLDARARAPRRTVGPPLPQSLLITGTVEDWEAWTSMAFPESGEYTFPEGLATLAIDRQANRGTYWEPNVWMIHPDITP